MNEPYPYFGALPCRERDEQERIAVADRFRDAKCETILTEDSASAIIALANYRRIKFFFQCEPWEIFPHTDEATIPRYSAPILKSLAQLSELRPSYTRATLLQSVLEKHAARTARTSARKERVRGQPSNKDNKWAHSAPRGGITTGDIGAAISSLQRVSGERESHNENTTPINARTRHRPAVLQPAKRTGEVAAQDAATPASKTRREESLDVEHEIVAGVGDSPEEVMSAESDDELPDVIVTEIIQDLRQTSADEYPNAGIKSTAKTNTDGNGNNESSGIPIRRPRVFDEISWPDEDMLYTEVEEQASVSRHIPSIHIGAY